MRPVYKKLLALAILAIGLTAAVPATHATAANLVPNPSFETAVSGQPSGWSHGKWGVNQTDFSYNTNGHTGTHSVQVTMRTHSSGDAKWYFAPQPVTGGTAYQVSDYYISNVTTRMVAAVDASDGTTQYFELRPATAATNWTKYADTVQVPSNAVSLTVFHLLDRVGYLRTDDYSVSAYNTGFTTGIVSLTFDDGYDSTYLNVLPLTNRYGVHSTFYIPTDFIGQSDRVTFSQIGSLAAAGNEIGSHSLSHPDLTTLSSTRLKKELFNSQSILQARYGPVTSFAIPFGAYNDAVLRQIKTYYASSRTSDVGYNTKANFNQYQIKTQNIYSTTTPAEVDAWVAQAQADRSWLVLLYHQVDASGSEYSTTPANLESNLQSITGHGLPVMTVTEAVRAIKNQL